MKVAVHQFPPALGLPNASSFCLKLTTYLRMAGIDHAAVAATGPFGAPRGKLPYVVLEDGTKLPDSNEIIARLEATGIGRLDAGLSAGERASAALIRATVEESLYFAVLHWRWVTDPGWKIAGPAFFGPLPPVARTLVGGLVRRKIARDITGQGTGRRPLEQIHARAEEELEALSHHLGARPHFLGQRPRSVDAAAFGLLANLRYAPGGGPIAGALARHANLIDFCDRIRDRYWADWNWPQPVAPSAT